MIVIIILVVSRRNLLKDKCRHKYKKSKISTPQKVAICNRPFHKIVGQTENYSWQIVLMHYLADGITKDRKVK